MPEDREDLDAPAAVEPYPDEPELTDEDLAGREAVPCGEHTGLCDDEPGA